MSFEEILTVQEIEKKICNWAAHATATGLSLTTTKTMVETWAEENDFIREHLVEIDTVSFYPFGIDSINLYLFLCISVCRL